MSSQIRTVVALNMKTNACISAESVTQMAEKLGTSRGNVSDVVNKRGGRCSVNAGGQTYVIA